MGSAQPVTATAAPLRIAAAQRRASVRTGGAFGGRRGVGLSGYRATMDDALEQVIC
jgi:hypothetical protein